MSAALGSLLPDAPADGVSNLRFSPTSDLLLASAWDGVSGPCYTCQESHILNSSLHDRSCCSGLFIAELWCRPSAYMTQPNRNLMAATSIGALSWTPPFRMTPRSLALVWIAK